MSNLESEEHRGASTVGTDADRGEGRETALGGSMGLPDTGIVIGTDYLLGAGSFVG